MKSKVNLLIKFFLFVAGVIGLLALTDVAKAAEVNQYTIQTSLTKAGQPITSSTTVGLGETFTVSNTVNFPDSQTIKSGDTFVLELPKEVVAATNLTFDVYDTTGNVVGSAVLNNSSRTVTVTFGNFFEGRPLNKQMLLSFDVTVDRSVVKESGTVNIRIGSGVFPFRYEATSDRLADYEVKYGYQDTTNPRIVKWRIILNARQDMLRGMVITDTFRQGQTLVEGSFRAVRYAPQATPVLTENELTALPVLDNFSSKAVFTKNEAGGITGFTIPFGDNYNWPMFIEYSTLVPEGVEAGTQVYNRLGWTATNFVGERTLEPYVVLQNASVVISGENNGQATIQVDKKLLGQTLEAGQFTFGLYPEGSTTPVTTTTNAADGKVTFSLTGLAAGTKKYVIKEIVPEDQTGYLYDRGEVAVTVTTTDKAGLKSSTVRFDSDKKDFTNVYQGQRTIEGRKIWVDQNQVDKRPTKITVRLHANGKEVQVTEIGASDDWKYRFENLPERDETGKEIQYSVTEDEVAGYRTTINGFDITNTLNAVPPTPKEPNKPKKELPKTGQESVAFLTIVGLIGLAFLSMSHLAKKEN
ncbi:Cna B-type domain-containing protein [Streptococcus sp. DD13]|uniref:Cna B-type domain-containing protein n=1 Tax=Streptococcus sp. DD13 TaxID=1777881 RepID=UPI0007959AF2|nr:Cna B-type domain-containing protein [Streptococcus sp. DD13]KXT78952.1 hypothetical protein STRDD13_00295 [Streptococcus sp. DD13]